MLHLISRRAWKQSQLGRVEGEAITSTPAMPSKKRKRSPSPQLETEAPSSKRDKRGRPSTSKIVEEPEEVVLEEENQPVEAAPRPSRNRRKTAKALEVEDESASTASEKETEAPPKTTGRRKSGRGEKAKDVEVLEETKEEDSGTHMTIVTGKGKRSKTTSIRIKPIPQPKDETKSAKSASPERPSGGHTGSHRKKRKSDKSDIKPLPPLEIPSDSITVKEESGIKLKLILSPKDRNQSVTEIGPEEPSTDEKKKSKKDKGKKGKEKGKKDEVKEDKLKAKLKFGDRVLSLDGDKVTHTKSKSSSKSKKRKHESEEEIPSPVVTPEKPSKKKKTVKNKTEASDVKPIEVVPVASPKSEKKNKKSKKDSKETVIPSEESPSLPEKGKGDSKSGKGKSHKDKDRHKSKDKIKEVSKVEENRGKDKKDKKKKKPKHDKSKSDVSAASRSDLELSHTSVDSFEDTDTSLVIDESPMTSKEHSSSSKKKKIKKDRDGERAKESSKESEGERTKESEKRKEKVKHKHHRHDKHHRSDKKHKKHKPEGDEHVSDHMVHKDVFGSPNTLENSFTDLQSINASAVSLANSGIPEGTVIVKPIKKSSSNSSSKPKKKVKKDPEKSGDDKEEKKDGKKEEKVKKPLSAYMLWCKETRPSVVAENPDANFAAISKLMGIKWHQLTEKDKAKWQNMQRKQVVKHKNIPTLSAKKMSSKRNSGHSGKPKSPKSPARLHPPNMEAIDIAAHLRLLGESLATVGRRLQEHQGEIEIHGSVSVLLDSTLCALGPLMALTSQVPEINGCSRDTHVSTLENIAYIMPGL